MLFLKNDGIQYRARVRRRGTAVSRTYKETSFTLYFLYYRSPRLCVCATWREWKRILEKGNVSRRGRSVPADRSIGRDFKADCPYKVKNFSWSPKRVSMHTLARVHMYHTYMYTHVMNVYNMYKPSLYLFPLRGKSSKCLLLFFKL